jgi:hypothetical protein
MLSEQSVMFGLRGEQRTRTGREGLYIPFFFLQMSE